MGSAVTGVLIIQGIYRIACTEQEQFLSVTIVLLVAGVKERCTLCTEA